MCSPEPALTPGDALIPTYEVTIEEGIVYVELPD